MLVKMFCVKDHQNLQGGSGSGSVIRSDPDPEKNRDPEN
jgi:hypothetical protein